MVETLDRLMEHLESQGERPKAVVWAHNSHLGDARATSMSLRGEWNVGQLVREWHEGETASVGFTTFQGTVTAASEWGAAAERKRVRLGLGLLRKNGYELMWFFSNVLVNQCPFRKLFELFETVLDEFWEACSGTVLFRRLSIQLSLGGLLSSRARFCFTGQRQCAPLAVLIHCKKSVVPALAAKQNAL
jgi:hypothetical protein